MAVAGAFEAGMVFAIHPPYKAGNDSAKAAVRFFGILTSILLAVGLLPQYYEIWKHKEVIGISILFMIVDAMGGAPPPLSSFDIELRHFAGLFSVLSLVFKPKFDIVAGVAYSVVFVSGLLTGIFGKTECLFRPWMV